VLLDIYVYELEKSRKGEFATKTTRVKREIAGYAEVFARARCVERWQQWEQSKVDKSRSAKSAHGKDFDLDLTRTIT